MFFGVLNPFLMLDFSFRVKFYVISRTTYKTIWPPIAKTNFFHTFWPFICVQRCLTTLFHFLGMIFTHYMSASTMLVPFFAHIIFFQNILLRSNESIFLMSKYCFMHIRKKKWFAQTVLKKWASEGGRCFSVARASQGQQN